MVKKTSEQNPVDEAYLRSLMAGSPPERVTPSVPQKGETDRETAEETKTEFEAEEMVGIAGKRQLTVGNYIDNVLREHFEKHSDEVKAYCQKSYNKIF